MTPTIKAIIGLVLLIVGAWVIYSGVQESETVTIILGVASVLGGIAFLVRRGGTHTSNVAR